MKIIKFKNPFERIAQKGIAAMLLCMVTIICGCSVDQEAPQVNYEDTFLKNLEAAPFVDVPREDLPEWLNERIDKLILEFVGKPLTGAYKTAEVHRGKWNDQTVYHVWTVFSSCLFCIYNENGEQIVLSVDVFNPKHFFSESNGWELIFKIVKGEIVGEASTKIRMSDYTAKITDKFEFPDISGMNDWERPNIIQERIAALQISSSF